jgi:predicted adenine nucleotide alpha hydrolase (AANH) superfamily ATPase
LRLFFYNPNIQPEDEYLRRRDALAYLGFAAPSYFGSDIPLLLDFPPRQAREHLLAVGGELFSRKRCVLCYRLRLAAAAKRAKELGYPAFTSALLYSGRQRHEAIKEEGGRLAAQYGLEFYYEDFRTGLKEGRRMSRELGLYRQRYCGCVFEGMEAEGFEREGSSG